MKLTLPRNLADNPEPYVKFMLVNYNSQDDLDEWAHEEMAEHVKSGKLLYVRERTAERFKHAHARNVAVRCCQTDVTCNVDADNFTGQLFGAFLHKVYTEAGDRPVFTAYGGKRGAPCGDLFGRISFRVRHLVAVGGYNEDLNTWGVEDMDVIKRAEMIGMIKMNYPPEFDTKPVEHTAEMRIEGSPYPSMSASFKASEKLHMGRMAVAPNPNAKGHWGVAKVEINWTRVVELPLKAGERLP